MEHRGREGIKQSSKTEGAVLRESKDALSMSDSKVSCNWRTVKLQ